FDMLLQELNQHASERFTASQQAVSAVYCDRDAHAIAEQLSSGQRLRVLGITSRFTTFLQHSMRDWLSAFERLGHQTLLLIEEADHQILNNIVYSRTAQDFQPD